MPPDVFGSSDRKLSKLESANSGRLARLIKVSHITAFYTRAYYTRA
jgi:hypothetical protein